eukprot:scaffold249328_cov12-Tisochrysis_lutea.AAC.1
MFDASFGATETLQPKFVHPLPWQLLHINQIPRACAEHLGNVQARGSLLARGGLFARAGMCKILGKTKNVQRA